PGTKTTGDYPPLPPRDPRPPRPPRPPVVVDGGGPMLPPIVPPAVVIQGSSPGPALAALPPPARPNANRPPPAARPPVPPPVRRGGGVPPANEQRYVPNEVVVQVAANLPNQGMTGLALRHRLLQLQSFPFLPGTTLVRYRIPDQRTVPQVITELEND